MLRKSWPRFVAVGLAVVGAAACSSEFDGDDAPKSTGGAGQAGDSHEGGTNEPVGGGDTSSSAGESAKGGESMAGAGGGSAGSGGTNEMPSECRPPGGVPTGTNKCGQGPWPAGDGSHFLIESFEDNNTTIELLDHREGAWAFVTDGSGSTFPADPNSLMTAAVGANGTLSSLHVKGENFALWGAALVLPFRGVCPYDASAYGGIEFWVKGSGKLAVEVREAATALVEFGGNCVNETDVQCCEDYHATQITLSADWQKLSFRWATLEQAGVGYSVPFDPTNLIGLSLNPGGQDFELWIDQVAFMPK